MAQITLPILSNSALDFVRVPLAPQIPPNNKDVVAAAKLVRDLTHNYANQKASEEDLADAIRYATLINADTIEDLPPRLHQSINDNLAQFFNDAFENHIPPAFQLMIQTAVTNALTGALPPLLAPIQDALGRLETKVERLEAKVELMETKLTRLEIMQAKMFNQSQSSGPNIQYMIVLFPDGRNPTAQPNALPPLDSVQAIKGLNDQYARRYVQGYYPNENLHGLGPSARLLRVVAAIGVHQSILE